MGNQEAFSLGEELVNALELVGGKDEVVDVVNHTTLFLLVILITNLLTIYT